MPSRSVSFRVFYPLLLRRLLAICVVAPALGLTGCTHMLVSLAQASKDGANLDAGMHAMMVRNDWKGMYAQADPGFRSATEESKFGDLMEAVSKKLGTPISMKQTSFRLNTTTSGTFLSSDCETVFSKNATAQESFVWRKEGDQYKLYGYHIGSNDLITR